MFVVLQSSFSAWTDVIIQDLVSLTCKFLELHKKMETLSFPTFILRLSLILKTVLCLFIVLNLKINSKHI